MLSDGQIDMTELVIQLNAQLSVLDGCVTRIRATDDVVGSLNIEVTLSADGSANLDVQSNVNDDARQSLTEGLGAVQSRGSGIGRAMVPVEFD